MERQEQDGCLDTSPLFEFCPAWAPLAEHS
jgi:hypothetical protein